MSASAVSIEGVAGAEVDALPRLVLVELEPGNEVKVRQLADAASARGFGPDLVTVEARGRFVEQDGKLRFEISGTQEVYRVRMARNVDDPPRDVPLEVSGWVSVPFSPERSALWVESFREPHPPE